MARVNHELLHRHCGAMINLFLLHLFLLPPPQHFQGDELVLKLRLMQRFFVLFFVFAEQGSLQNDISQTLCSQDIGLQEGGVISNLNISNSQVSLLSFSCAVPHFLKFLYIPGFCSCDCLSFEFTMFLLIKFLSLTLIIFVTLTYKSFTLSDICHRLQRGPLLLHNDNL